MRTPIGYWTSWQWRQLWDLGVNCPQTNKISENFMIRDSICVSSCCSEYIATRMPTNCWTDAVANCANNNSMFTSWLMWCLSQMRTVFMAALWNRAGHYIFALWFLSSSFFFFPRLISAVGDWMSTILPHLTLGMLLHYLGKLKIQNFCCCGRKRKQIAFLISCNFVIHQQILIFSVFKIANLFS